MGGPALRRRLLVQLREGGGHRLIGELHCGDVIERGRAIAHRARCFRDQETALTVRRDGVIGPGIGKDHFVAAAAAIDGVSAGTDGKTVIAFAADQDVVGGIGDEHIAGIVADRLLNDRATGDRDIVGGQAGGALPSGAEPVGRGGGDRRTESSGVEIDDGGAAATRKIETGHSADRRSHPDTLGRGIVGELVAPPIGRRHRAGCQTTLIDAIEILQGQVVEQLRRRQGIKSPDEIGGVRQHAVGLGELRIGLGKLVFSRQLQRERHQRQRQFRTVVAIVFALCGQRLAEPGLGLSWAAGEIGAGALGHQFFEIPGRGIFSRGGVFGVASPVVRWCRALASDQNGQQDGQDRQPRAHVSRRRPKPAAAADRRRRWGRRTTRC